MEKFYKKGHLARKGKRWLALLMSVCLIGTMIPVTARAETAENIGSDEKLSGQTGEQTEGKLITTWQWIDEEEYLDEETGNLALPGASEQTPAYFDDVISFLPTQIQATVVNADDSENPEIGVEEAITLGDWSCDNYPVDGAYSGSYTFTATLPENYALFEEAEALEVLVELGGAQMWYDNGSWGNGLFWELNDEGILTIWGEGEIPNVIMDWDGQAASVKEIVIEENVTGIGNMGLLQCKNLTSVTIPSTVTSIGEEVFNGCESLTTVSFAEECSSTLSIGEFAFINCTALESIVIPNYVTTLGYGAFQGCRILQSVTFEAGSQLKAISDCTFYGCDKLETINIPSSVESIGDSAFAFCTSLKSITIPDSVTTIDRAAFWGCSALESIMIPESVTTIGDDIFKECSNLKKVTCISGSYAETYLREKYPELLTVLYKVTIHSDSVEGYTITQADKTAFPESGQLLTDADGSLSFRIEAASGYKKNFTVKADGTEVTAVDGVYTISGITGNKTIALTIEGAGQCSHSKYNNGFCTECDAYEPAVYNESKNYYEISNTGQLYWFAGLVNGDASVCTGDVTKNPSANAVLMKSITVNEGVLKSDGTLVDGVSGFTSWTPIGNYEVNNVSYEGTFDGQGFTISGLYCVADNEYVGFVGNSSGTIKNLGIIDSYFKGKESVGAVCGSNFSGAIINCFSACYIDAAGNNAGGVCGYMSNGTITNCYNIGSVTASSYAHSICGQDNNGGGNITNCFFLDTKPSDGYATGKSEDEFNSGEVAYLLSQGKDGEVWGQKLGENGDAYPVLKKAGDEGNTVYRNETYNGCEGNKGEPVYSYSNTQEDPVYGGHSYKKSGDGTYHECTVCGDKIYHSNVATFTADNTVYSITANCSECGDLGTITLAEPAGDLSYTGEAKAATVTGAISGITTPDITYVKSDGTDLGTTAPTSVGIYTASITLGTGDGAKTISVTYEITKAAASVGTAPSAKPGLTYNGNAQALVTEGSATAGTGTLQYSTSKNGAYSTDIPTGTDAKQYSVWYKVVGGTNYADTEPVEIQVTIAPLNITDKNPTITLGTALTYTGAEQTQTVSGVTCDGLPVTYTVSGDKGTNAGGYTLTVTGTGNFTGTATKDFSIGKKSLTGTSQTLLVKKNQAKVVTYDLSKLLPEGVTGTTDYAVGMVTNEKGVLSAAPTDTDITDGKLTLHVASVESADQTASVQITFTNSNYDISTATLTVKTTDKTPVSLSSVTCGSRVYNGTAYAYTGTPVWKTAEGEAATGETTVTYYEVKNLDENITVYIPLQAAPTDAGSYRAEFTITSDDYVGTASYSFEITKAVITVAAKNKSIYVGDAVPDLTTPMVGTDYTVTGLCGTDALGGTAAMSYAQKPDNTKTGTYEILISGLTAPEGDNYTITYTNGTLTITTKPSSGDSTGGDSSSGGSSGGGSSSGGSSGGGSTGGGSSSGGSSGGGSSSGGTSSGGSSSGGSSSGAAGEAADKPADSGNTTTTTNKDGSTTTTTTETDANGNTVTTTTTVATDGSTTEKVQEAKTNAAGKEVELTTTTKTDADGNVTGVTEKSVINHIEKNTTATVTVKTDGNVTSAKASITKTSDSSKVSLSGKVLEQITEAAGADTKVRVTMTVKDSKGNTKYKVQADADEIVSGEKLYIYKLDTKTGKYTMVDAKEYKVTKAGTVTINMTKKATYELVTVQESKAITKEILATVKPAKNSTSLSKDRKTTFKLSAKLDMDNVKSVTYTTSKESIAAISKKGTITAVKAGTATIKATITLKNDTKKTVKMTIKVN